MILGVISAIESGGLQLLIDGEEEPTTKEYCYVASYLPIAGDRVLIEEINGTYVVIGKVVQTSGGGETYADHAGYADTAGTASTAVYAASAGTAEYAGTASTAVYATSCGTAATATTASYAVASGTASYANNAYSCTTASYAVSAGTATYANIANSTSYATSCGTASTAVSATSAEAVKDWYSSWGDNRVYFRIYSGELQYSTGTYQTWHTLQNK